MRTSSGTPCAERSSAPAPLLYCGPVPRRRLRLSEYLFYTGQISWRQHMAALRWQRQVRPTLGQLAVEGRYLPSDQLPELLHHHACESRGERFGEYAERCGYLTRSELQALVERQRGLGYPVGRFFLDRGLCTEDQIAAAVEQQRRHAR